MKSPILPRLLALGDVLKLNVAAAWLGIPLGTWHSRKARGSPDLTPAECKKLIRHLTKLQQRINSVIAAMERRAKEGER